MNSSRCRIGHATGKWLNPVPFGADPKHRPHDGAGHGFFNRGEDYPKTLAEADAFLVELGWIKK